MIDVKCILCPTDFSEGSRHAIAHAIVLARYYEARIVGLHVYNPVFAPVAAGELTGYGAVAVATEFSHDVDPVAFQRDIDASLAAAGPAGVEVHATVKVGRVAAQILDEAARVSADLIVMGTHGAGGFERLMLGSVTEKVLRKAACPVLTVPPRAQATSALPYKRILCPVDFSEPSLRALQFALSLAQEGDAHLLILHVLEWPVDSEPAAWPLESDDYRKRREQEAAKALRGLLSPRARDWCEPTTRVGHGTPYREILTLAAEERADVIVMGVHGRHALDHLLFGSTTNHVVRQATCPVLTLRSADVRRGLT